MGNENLEFLPDDPQPGPSWQRRGWPLVGGEQVAEPSFLQKFLGARLSGGQLDRAIDNISGATLSVQMMQRMARTVLTLDASAG